MENVRYVQVGKLKGDVQKRPQFKELVVCICLSLFVCASLSQCGNPSRSVEQLDETKKKQQKAQSVCSWPKRFCNGFNETAVQGQQQVG